NQCVVLVVLLALIGEIDFPVDAVFHLGYSGESIRGMTGMNIEKVSGQKTGNALERGERPRHGEEGEDMVDAAQVGANWRHTSRENRLDLGSEQKPVSLTGPVERANAKAVPRQDQPPGAAVPQGKGILAAQPIKHFLAVFFPEMRDD